MLRWSLTILLASIVLAAPAQALPPDPLGDAVDAGDGAVVPVDSDGIAVTYSCPVYKPHSVSLAWVSRSPRGTEGLRGVDVDLARTWTPMAGWLSRGR